MDNERYITIQQLCRQYEVEVAFIHSLGENGLLHIIRETEEECIGREELADLERMIRLHYELDINLAGIEAIHHLLSRVREMQKELIELRNKLGNS
jgi:hypothetical protein